jgi:NADH-quinone oxidoreductase subunit G
VSAELRRVAHVLLPAGTFAETSGTFVNLEGRWQSFTGAARAVGAARPAWKILRVLGNLLNFSGFDYESSEQVRDELKKLVAQGAAASASAAAQAANAATTGAASAHVVAAGAGSDRVVDLPMYQIDGVVRRAVSLQRTRDGQASASVYGAA